MRAWVRQWRPPPSTRLCSRCGNLQAPSLAACHETRPAQQGEVATRSVAGEGPIATEAASASRNHDHNLSGTGTWTGGLRTSPPGNDAAVPAGWVLSVPYRLRFRMAYSLALNGAVPRCFIATITSDLRRRASRHGIRGDLQTGVLTVIQRFGSALGRNVHFHSPVLDGGRMLARQPPAEDRQASLLDELANASVQCPVATGPWRGCRILRLGRPLPRIAPRLCRAPAPWPTGGLLCRRSRASWIRAASPD